MDRRLVVAGAVIVVAVAILAWPRKQESPEAQVRRLIATCVEAAEKRDLGPFDEALADDFRGGGMGKREVKQLLLGQLFRNSNGLVVLNPQLTVQAAEATASFSGVFVFARARDVDWQEPGDGVSRYDIEGTLERRGGEWKLTTAEWKR
ncbi:MAG: hypothetical protein INH41_09655 [Myxococcaceae bacterium]|jgi:hypothetical protein|nr:hypothetical protein [Myxococcaceae bacterium]